MSATLVSKSLPGNPVKVRIGAEATLGRGATNSVVVAEEFRAVSNTHARIRFDEERGSYVLEDLDSANGTRLDGRPVRGAERLEALHVITLAGQVDFVFRDPSAGERDAPQRAASSSVRPTAATPAGTPPEKARPAAPRPSARRPAAPRPEATRPEATRPEATRRETPAVTRPDRPAREATRPESPAAGEATRLEIELPKSGAGRPAGKKTTIEDLDNTRDEPSSGD